MEKDYEIFIVDVIKKFYDFRGVKYPLEHSIYQWLVHYFNFRLRFIESYPRNVFVSNELNQKLKNHERGQNVIEIIQKLKEGVDINAHQSTRLMDVHYDDNLFNDWEIHHLHLSNRIQRNASYFFERTSDLLFLKFAKADVYLLDIMPHNCFSKKDLIGIIQNNWNYLIEHKRIKSESGLVYPDLTEDQIKMFRRHGFTVGVNVNGKGYMMLGGGYASSGDSMDAIELCNRLLAWIGNNLELKDKKRQIFERGILDMLYLS